MIFVYISFFIISAIFIYFLELLVSFLYKILCSSSTFFFQFFLFCLCVVVILIVALFVCKLYQEFQDSYYNNYSSSFSHNSSQKNYFGDYEENYKENFKEKDLRKDLVEKLLDNDNRYRIYKNIILNFNPTDFDRLFIGELESEEDIKDICKRYNIFNIRSFTLLCLKFENFGIILQQWYKDKTKYIYIEKLWTNFIILCELKNLKEEELEVKLSEINYKNLEGSIKKELKIFINNSSTLPRDFMEMKNYINDPNIKPFLTLIENALSYKDFHLSTIANEKKMKDYEINLGNIIKYTIWHLIKEILYKNNSIKESKTKLPKLIDLIIADIKENFNNTKKQEFNYKSFIFDNNANFIHLFTNWKSNNVVQGAYCILSLLNLCNLISDIFDFDDLKVEKDNEFRKRLREIYKNFQEHKMLIKNLSENLSEDIDIISDITNKIKKDYEDISVLKEEIKNTIEEQEIKKTKYNKKSWRSFEVCLSSLVGLYFTSGIVSIATISTSIFHGISGLYNLFKYKKKTISLKELQNILKNVILEQAEIAKELNKFLELIIDKKTNGLPRDIKYKIMGNFFPK